MTPEDDPLPPSNTLLVSRLTPELLQEEMLGLLRNLIHPQAPIWSWNLDRKHSSIKISFYDIKSAKFIKDALEREPILGCMPRISFAPAIDTSPPPPQYLELPKSDKLFFISPPPSPPHDWEMRNEGPPNTETHAHDLAFALKSLENRNKSEHKKDAAMNTWNNAATSDNTGNRERSSSFTIYHPDQHGSHPALPVISVEDTEPTLSESPVDQNEMEIPQGMVLKTERPPIEV